MKKSILVLVAVFGFAMASFSQQRMNVRGMNYLYNPKPNSILYHDTLFSGSKQFQQLFYRHGDIRLITLYEHHQSNKIAGQVVGIAAAVGLVFGIRMVTSSGNEKSAGWAVLGGSFAASITAGYLNLMSQKNMQMAVTLFNSLHNTGQLGIGVGDKAAGLVLRF